MRKNLFVGVIIFALVFAFSGKLVSAELGVKFGLSVVNLDISNKNLPVDFYSRKEFTAGAFVSFNIARSFAFQPEIYYVVRGVNYDEEIFGEIVTNKYKLQNIEIPLLLKYKIPVKGIIQPGIFAGPYVGFNFKAVMVMNQGFEDDMTPYTKSMDAGLVFGGCIDFKLSFGKLILDVRYNLGLADITKNLTQFSDEFEEGDTVKNRVFTIMIGLGF